MTMTVRPYQGIHPEIGNSVYIDESAVVVGDVTIGDDSSIWPLTLVRGDVNKITIGSRSNIQDGSILHVTHPHKNHPEGFLLHVGDNVTVGHKVVLHGCQIGDNCLIGMGSIIMDGAIVQPGVMVGAGSLVAPNKELESGYLYVGSPVKKVRSLTAEEQGWLDYSATHYVNLKNRYLED